MHKFSVLCVQFESRQLDVEFVQLMQDLQSTEIVDHKYRGYTLLTQDGRNFRSIKVSILMLWHVISCLFLWRYVVLKKYKKC
jgi:hypothetical protein